MSKCHALTNKGTPCKNGIKSGATIDHDGHLHYLCGPHYDKKDSSINTEFCPKSPTTPTYCPVCKEDFHTPLNLEMHMDEYEHNIPEQASFDLPNTDGLLAVEHVREIMEADNEDFGFDHDPREVSVMLTGTTEIVNEQNMLKEMIRILLKMVEMYGKVRVISGGAVGADRLWALAARKVTVEHGINVPFDIYVPIGYEDVFVKKDAKNRYRIRENWQMHMERFAKMLSLADNVYDQRGNLRKDGTYVKGSNYTRNLTMVNKANVGVIVSDTPPSQMLKVKQGEPNYNRGTYHGTRALFAAEHIDTVFWIKNIEEPTTQKINKA